MKASWFCIFLIPFFWFACQTDPLQGGEKNARISAADSVRISASIDSLSTLADTATAANKAALLIRIADLNKSLHSKDAWVDAIRALFSFYHKNRQYDELYPLLDQAVRDSWWEPDSKTGQLYTLLGFTLRRLGRNYAAGIYYEKARELSDRFGGVTQANPAGVIHKTLANIKTRLGEHEEAEKLFLTALELLEQDSLPERAAANRLTMVEIHNDLGLAYQTSGDLPKALEQYEAGLQALGQLNKLDPGKGAAAANTKGLLLSSKASVLFLSGRHTEAEQAARAALDSYDPDKNNYRFNGLTILSGILENSGKLPAAQKYRDEALALANGGGVEQREIAKLLIEMGWSAYRTRDFLAATQFAQQALNRIYAKISPVDVHQNPDPALLDPDPENAIAEALDLKGEALWQQYRSEATDGVLQLADSTTALAIQMMENLRDAAVYESSKLHSSQQSRRLFSRMLAILFAQQKNGDQAVAARAFAFAEKNKAVLLQQKIAADAAMRSAGVADSLIRQERDFKERRAFLQNALFEAQIAEGSPDEKAIEALKRQLYAVEQDLRQLQSGIASAYHIETAHAHTQTATVDAVRQKLLRKDELWIDYFTDPDSSLVYMIAVSHDALQFVRRPYRETAVRDFIALFNNAIQAENKAGDPALFSEFVRTAQNLYDDLLAPVVPQSIPKRITLVADGALALLPFDVLLCKPVDTPAGVNYTTLPYLVATSQTRLAASASLDLFYARHGQPKRRDSYAGFAPDYSGSILGQVVSGSGVVQSVAADFNGKAFLGPDASLETFMKEAAGYAIIHFHGHAEASDSFPDHSWMAFTAGRPIAGVMLPQESVRTLGSGPRRLPASELAHCLFAHQVYHARLNADLVLLSACQTGLGKIAPGEGTLSLSRAFQAAGCPATVMSLWEVRDDATAELMQLFLENIRQGQDKDEALTNAKRSYLQTSGDAFPYYWAGFVLTGKAAPVQLHGGWWKRPVFWLLVLGVLAVAVFLFRSKFFKKING
ncbi:MAG: CHAT domain-containing tetratricopeptide repeat protein [Saprospiraceae bacterium]